MYVYTLYFFTRSEVDCILMIQDSKNLFSERMVDLSKSSAYILFTIPLIDLGNTILFCFAFVLIQSKCLVEFRIIFKCLLSVKFYMSSEIYGAQIFNFLVCGFVLSNGTFPQLFQQKRLYALILLYCFSLA